MMWLWLFWSAALGACPVNPASGRFGLDWGTARTRNLTGNNCLFLSGSASTVGWQDSMCTVGEPACIAPAASTRKCSWVRCTKDSECLQDGRDFKCGRVFIVEDSGLSQVHLLTLAPTPLPTPPPSLAGTTLPATTLPPTPRPSTVNEDGQPCGVGLLDCACNARFECDRPGSCQREPAPPSTAPPGTVDANATTTTAAATPQFVFVCRCVTGNEGCDCIPSLLSDRPCQAGLFCVDNKCSATPPPGVTVTNGPGGANTLPGGAPASPNASGGTGGADSLVSGSATTLVAGLEDWQLGAIIGGGALLLIIVVALVVFFSKRRGGRGYDYDAYQKKHTQAMPAPLYDAAAIAMQPYDASLDPSLLPPSIVPPPASADTYFDPQHAFQDPTGAVLPTSEMAMIGVAQVSSIGGAAAPINAFVPPPPPVARPLPVPMLPPSAGAAPPMQLQPSHNDVRMLPPAAFHTPMLPPPPPASPFATPLATPFASPRPLPSQPPPNVTVTPLPPSELAFSRPMPQLPPPDAVALPQAPPMSRPLPAPTFV